MKKTRHVKDKKITLLEPIEKTDEYGFDATTYEPLPGGENIWAYYRQVSGNEFYAARTVNVKVEAIFEIAWRDDLKSYFQLRYKGQDYNITRIDDYEGYKRNLRIYAYKVN